MFFISIAMGLAQFSFGFDQDPEGRSPPTHDDAITVYQANPQSVEPTEIEWPDCENLPIEASCKTPKTRSYPVEVFY